MRQFATAASGSSSPPLNVEFESEESKIEDFSPGVTVLPAGSTAIVTEVLMDARRVSGEASPPGILNAAEALRAAYERVRATKAEIQIALPMVGHEFIDLRARRGAFLPNYLQPQPMTYQQITVQMSQLDFNTELLVAGFEGTDAKIAVITNPGQLFWLDKLGYGAIGSGGIHALATLNLSGQVRSRGLLATLHAVYVAKSAAEVAPGVGQTTDLGVIDRTTGRMTFLHPKVLDVLAEMRRKKREAPPPDLRGLKDAYEGNRGP